MDDRIVRRTTPFLRHQSRRRIRTRQRRREDQFLLQRGTHLLVGLQLPPFANRTTPMLILGVLAVPHFHLDHTDDRAQVHGLLAPVMPFASAEGGKLRLGGPLLPEAFAPADGASIRALLLKLPVRLRAVSALAWSPRSWGLSLVNGFSLGAGTDYVRVIMVVVSRCARITAELGNGVAKMPLRVQP